MDSVVPLTRQAQKEVVDNLRSAVECIVDDVFFRGLIPNRFRGRRDSICWNDIEVMVSQNPNDVRATHTIYDRLSNAGLHLGYAQQVAPLTKPQLESYYNHLKTLVDNAGL